jgi:manganese efflux pump family protein
MSVRVPRRRNHAATAAVAAAVALAGLAGAGCSHQSAALRGSVESCIQFGIEAIRHHTTVTSLPPACRGLTRAQVNFAVGSALHSAAIGARGKARQRERIGKASHFLERLVTAVPQQRSQPPVPAPPAQQASRAALGLIAACTWLITAGLGVWMMARWIARRRRRRAPAGQPRRLPALNLAHLGLATTGLLAWSAYLATGVTGVAWAACALLLPVAGLGLTLVFLPPSQSPAQSAPTAQAVPRGTAAVPAADDPPRARHPPILVLSAHIAFATATILLAFLTAIGTS